MDARQLGYFLAVVDHGGFGRAAEQIRIAQPSLSQAIANLERELGVPLFHRVGRGVVLSEAGRELVEPARQVLRDLDVARAAAESVKGLRTGRLDLVTMPAPGIQPLTSMMRRFADEHPGIEFHVDGAFTADEVVASVRTGVAEIGLLGSAGDVHTAELRVVPLEDQPLILISPLDHGLPDGETVQDTDLEGRRLIVSQYGTLMRRWVDGLLDRGIQVRIAADVAHRTSILTLVLAGFGHAVMPAAWTPLAERAGAAVHRIEPACHLRVALVSRPDGLTPAAKAFLELALKYES